MNRRGAVLAGVAVLGVAITLLVVLTPLGTALDRAVGNGCRIVDSADVEAVMGGDFGMERLDPGEADQPVDIGVIDGDEVCWAMDLGQDKVRHVTVVRRTTSAAEVIYAAARADAANGTEDADGRTRSRPYLNKDVDDAGDEAFCTTTTNFGASGILVRRGDRLTYVSVSADEGGDNWADAEPDEALRSNDEDLSCDLARRIEEKVHR
ncbi:MAG TPA: hypothetical protein VGD67_25780 [Pseudonocardiaceae bacterium]